MYVLILYVYFDSVKVVLNIFHERLKYLRKNNNITQKTISNYLEIHINSYQKYEQGTREPNFDTLLNIADYFNVSIDYLFARTDNPEINR